MITICNLRKVKPHYPWDVRVCRFVSVLGNPFVMHTEARRNTVCNQYIPWLLDKLNVQCDQAVIAEFCRLRKLHEKHGQLRLFCWCAPKRCHAETIKKFLEE